MRKYTNINQAVAAAKAWKPNTGHTQVGYDPAEDRVVWEDNVGSTHIVWVDGVINIGDYAGQVTVKQLKADIEEVISRAGNQGAK